MRTIVKIFIRWKSLKRNDWRCMESWTGVGGELKGRKKKANEQQVAHVVTFYVRTLGQNNLAINRFTQNNYKVLSL